MSCRSNEVQTGVHSCVVVSVQHSLDLQLFMEVGVKLCINVIHDRLPAETRVVISSINKSFNIYMKSFFFSLITQVISIIILGKQKCKRIYIHRYSPFHRNLECLQPSQQKSYQCGFMPFFSSLFFLITAVHPL